MQGLKLKDKNRKRKERECKDLPTSSSISTTPLSTERVRKHRENKRLIVNLNFNRSSATTRRSRYLSTKMKDTRNSFSPKTKRSPLTQLINTFSPETRAQVASDTEVPENHSSRMDMSIYDDLKKRRDRLSNFALILLLKSSPAATKHKGIRRSSIRRAKLDETSHILKHYKTVKKAKKVDPALHEKIMNFYEKDSVSRVLPYKNMTKVVKDQFGTKKRVPVRVMELTIKDSFKLFCQENQDVHISKRTFENYRPKNIRLKRDARRLVCCCQHHANVDYIRKLLNLLFSANNKTFKFKNSAELVDAPICSQNNISCVVGDCKDCKDFPKLDNLGIEKLHCSKKCVQEDIDCSKEGHTIKVLQFERKTYLYRGGRKEEGSTCR